MTCNCPEPQLCRRLNRHLHGRVYHLYKNDQRYTNILESQRPLSVIEHVRKYFLNIKNYINNKIIQWFKPIVAFITAIKRHWKNHFRHVNKMEYYRRLNICSGCEFVNKIPKRWQCTLCGCMLKEGFMKPGKSAWESEQCPIGKWMVPTPQTEIKQQIIPPIPKQPCPCGR